MKKLIIFLLTIACFTNCSDPCDDVNCQNGSTCDDGTCLCVEGYIGTNCETEIRAEYLDNWNFSFICDGNSEDPSDFFMITADPANILGIIMNVEGGVFKGTVDGNGNITISDQEVIIDGMLDDTRITGSGKIDNNIIILDVVVTSPTRLSNCTFTLTR